MIIHTHKKSLIIVSFLALFLSSFFFIDHVSATDCKGIPNTTAYNNCMNTAGNYDSSKGTDCANIPNTTAYTECISNPKNYDSNKGGSVANKGNGVVKKIATTTTKSLETVYIEKNCYAKDGTPSNVWKNTNAYKECVANASNRYGIKSTNTTNSGSDSAIANPGDSSQTPVNNPGLDTSAGTGDSTDPAETAIPDTNATADEVTITYGTAASFDGREGDACQGFLGLISWDCNVNISDQASLESGISTIAVNVLTDIIIIATYLIIGYTIYGGYLYIFSAGDTSKVASGKKTLTHAFIGLAIVLSARLIMSTIRFALLNGSAMANCATSACVNDPSSVIVNAIHWVIGVSGIVAAIFIIYGGVTYATSSGDPSKLQKAKQVITYALIGLAIVALAEVITAFVSNMIRSANNQTSDTTITKDIIIAKELYEEKIT